MSKPRFPLLPIGTEVVGLKSGPLLQDFEDFQILATDGVPLLLVAPVGDNWAARASNRELLAELQKAHRLEVWNPARGGALCVLVEPTDRPVIVSDMPKEAWPLDKRALERLVSALIDLRTRAPESSWGRALYLPDLATCFDRGAGEAGKRRGPRELLTRIMTGGLLTDDLARIAEVNPALSLGAIEEAFASLGLEGAAPRKDERDSALVGKPAFVLAGRRKLSQAFEDYVIDYWRRPAHYQALGYRPPNGILLYGPPGSGKTHAIERLAEYLGWPVERADLGEVGSPYIHETVRRLRQLFKRAAERAPAIVIMNEVDALTMSRDGRHEHKVEELNELLQLVERAAEQKLLIVATTNRLEAIDKAFLRRGRFDLKLEVDFPSETEVAEALEAIFSERPLAEGVDLAALAKRLAGRPMSDLGWLANEASRLAARGAKTRIDELVLAAAIRNLN